jgi:ABC-type polysaccharide/polyol phosphate export permease
VITDNAQLITKTIIPAEILPIAITLSNLVNHAIGLSVLLVVLAVFETIPLSALGILLYLPILVLFAQGLGWIVAGLQVFVRDTVQVLQIALSVWFWLTPVMYGPERLGDYQVLAMLSPMAVVVTGYRNSLLGLSQPDVAYVALAAAISITVFLVGGLIFRQTKPAFADVL